MEVDPDTVLWADDAYDGNGEPSVEGWSKIIARHGYRVTTVTSTGEALHAYRHKMRNEGKIYRHVILDMNMDLGDCPSDIEQRIKRELGPLAGNYSSVTLPPILREETGMDITVGALTGEISPGHDNTHLEQLVTKARFQYVLAKTVGTGTLSHLGSYLRKMERKLPEDSGLNILVTGERGSGKTTTCRLIYGMQRGDLHKSQTAMDGPLPFPKLTTEKVNSLMFPDAYDEACTVKQLAEIENELRAADEARLGVLYVHEGRKRRFHFWIVRKEGKRVVKEALERINVNLELKSFYSFEDFSVGSHGMRIDFTTNTTNIEAAKKIIDYSNDFNGAVLPVRIDIEDNRLVDRIATRAGLPKNTIEVLKSSSFINANPAQRAELILNTKQRHGKRLHYRGQLTDFGMRTLNLYEQNQRWRNEFNPPGLFRINGDTFLPDVMNLQEEILRRRTDR